MEIEDEMQEECDDNWTEADKAERIEMLQSELIELQQLSSKVQTGCKPRFAGELYTEGICYLFGCKQHGHKEYDE